MRAASSRSASRRLLGARAARHVIRNQPGMILFFLALIGIATFGLLNIIVGVVVENTLATATKDERKARKAEDPAPFSDGSRRGRCVGLSGDQVPAFCAEGLRFA